jgi:ATP-dependent RNA helicase RhlE
MTFKELNLVEPILKALSNTGYSTPTPIQQQAIPILLRGKDLLGCAQTGTGKTAAFAIPILQHIYLQKQKEQAKPGQQRPIKALIVTPTRELAIQIADSFTTYGKYMDIQNTVIFGGVKQHAQTNELRKGVDILVATPGRLLDLMDQGFISLQNVEYFVLDEADHMLDMGFVVPIKKIIAKLPAKRQSLFFSATMPPAIIALSGKILGKYEEISIQPEQATAERVDQGVYFVEKGNKTSLLIHLIKKEKASSTLVFSRTKHGANKIVKSLDKAGIKSEAIHGNKSQVQRQKALASFKSGETQVLIATDIAARGIDVSGLALVINFDLPNVAETYVHRIGRTGRAQASGIALSFCDDEERAYLKDIEKLIGQRLPVMTDNPFKDVIPEPVVEEREPRGREQNRGPRPSPKRGERRPNDNRNNNTRSNDGNRSNSGDRNLRENRTGSDNRSSNGNSSKTEGRTSTSRRSNNDTPGIRFPGEERRQGGERSGSSSRPTKSNNKNWGRKKV